MSNAGYGNHDAPPPNVDPTTAKTTPGASNSGISKTDGTNAAPSSVPAPPERRDSSTPGEGALSDGAQGDDVDPGVG